MYQNESELGLTCPSQGAVAAASVDPDSLYQIRARAECHVVDRAAGQQLSVAEGVLTQIAHLFAVARVDPRISIKDYLPTPTAR
jgi:hypothetical protein